MTGLYSPINRLMGQVTRPKGTGAEYMAELQKKPGYKPAEAEDRDLQTLMALPQMERAVFMEKLKGQKNKFPLKMKEHVGSHTHHESYTLPGGENYREMLLHTPMPEGKGFEGVPQHFGGAPNVIASVRVKDRTSPEGKKILHIEEIQSDWHQQGREGGYQPADLDKRIAELIAQSTQIQREWLDRSAELRDDPQAYLKLAPIKERGEVIRKQIDKLREEPAIPYGPHAKDWHELALKAMIQHAAENGYDQIAVTPGAEQAKRFGLSKQVGSVSYHPETQHFQAFKPNRETITNEKGATPERVKALIGKEAAAKLLQAPKTMGHHYLEGEDLDIGGEGMKGFYDKMVPTFLNKFGKKHGVQVQPGAINTDDPNGHSQTAMLRASGVPEHQWGRIPYEEKERMMAEYSAKQPPSMTPVHTFDITPEMRDDVVKNGIPRYAEGGDVNDSDRMTPRSRGRASFGAAPRGNRIIKETGGNWIGGSVEDALKSLRRRTAGGMEPTEALAQMKKTYPAETTDPALTRRQVPIVQGLEQDASLNNWIDRNLSNYVKKQMATKEDPVRKLAEQGITHLPQDAINRGQWESDHLGKIRRSEGFPESGLATNEASRGWENLADEAIQITAPIVANKEMMEANPWLSKLPPTQSVYRARKADISELGFDHIVDVLKQDVAAGRIRPEQLNKISMEQAVRRAYEFDQEQVKKMRETSVKATEGMPVHKEYDTGHKWIELTKPEPSVDLPSTHEIDSYTSHALGPRYRVINKETGMKGEGFSNPERAINEFNKSKAEENLENALKYEGDTMGHCVGGYTPDVLSGHSRIYSLRDAKGEPHVTVEVQPSKTLTPEKRNAQIGFLVQRLLGEGMPEEKALTQANKLYPESEIASRIVQIKGKQNRAPDKKYLPYVQDFVKGGQWSDVGDAKNAGLRKYGDVFNVNEQRQIEKTGEQVPEHEWLAGEDIQRLHNAITPPGKRLKYDPYGNVTGNEGGYAKGGSVSRETADVNKAKFLKGSKVPERVYHGTGNLENITSFDPAMTGKGTDQLGSGFYFSSNPDTASGYATSVTQNAAPGTPKLGGNTSPGMVAAHLAIRKPIKVGPKGNNLNDSNVKLTHDQVKRIMAHAPALRDPDESPLGNHFDLSRGVTPKMIHDVAQYYTGPQTLHMLENDMFPHNPTEYRHALHKVLGYDGVVKDFGNGEKHYVAWFPEQIKSAIGNRGTYDPNEPDIAKAAGGVVKEKVTISPDMDVMQYELINRKAK